MYVYVMHGVSDMPVCVCAVAAVDLCSQIQICKNGVRLANPCMHAGYSASETSVDINRLHNVVFIW